MTVTDQQIRAITFLAKASRPNGARRWDEAGIAAAVEQVRDRSLPEVILATIRAAADRDVDTPGVIPTNGSHWAESAAVRPYTPDTHPTADRCSTCFEPEDRCRRLWRDDHDYRSVAQAAAESTRAPETAKRIVDAVKAEVAPTAPPTPRKTLDDLLPSERDERYERVRAGLRQEPIESEGAA